MVSPLPPVSSKDDPASRLILKDINITIKQGSFVAIIGDVGSGKSSLLLSLIGEMRPDPQREPHIEITGSVGYVSQHPWILNTTVKNNILLDADQFSTEEYQNAVKFSCLQSDLEVLTTGDKTEIGEKGINLSGGQKARVSLARSLYRDCDIYLLDDPLSAVDAHVGNYILQECILGHLKQKTRVLVTHKFESLKYVDYVYIMKKGRVVESGTYENLKDGALFHEIEAHVKDKGEEEEDKTDENVNSNNKGELKEKIRKESIVVDKRQLKPTELEQLALASDEEAKKLEEKLMLDEDKEEGLIKWSVFTSFIQYYGGTCSLVVSCIIVAIWTFGMLASNLWLALWSNDANESRYSKNTYFIVYSAAGIGSAILSLIRTLPIQINGIKCSIFTHDTMIARILRAPINLFFDRVPAGRLLNRLSKDLSTIDTELAVVWGTVLSYGFLILTDLTAFFVAGSVWVLPTVFLTLYIGLRLQKRFMGVNREVVRLESISKSAIVSFFSESINGLTAIRAYQEETKFYGKFHRLQDDNVKNKILVAGTVIVIAPTLVVSILVKTDNLITLGMVGVLISYVLALDDDINFFLWMVSLFESYLVAVERCKAFMEIPSEAPAKTANPASIEAYSTHWPAHGAIEFRNYSVKYRPSLPYVIEDLNLNIQAGEKIGVVGRTGSGKSTLLLSLIRIIESSAGAVLIDSVDISQLGLDDLRRRITIIPQDPILFQGTLRTNLDPLNQYTDEQLLRSLDRVCMKAKFEQEDGLNTLIKEGGHNLSAGERQLLCIGRAILAQSRVVLIDEATSSIDEKTEQTVLQTILESFHECTVITIAHRLKTIRNTDRVLVMSEGKAVEFGGPKELLRKEDGHFQKLWTEYQKAGRDE